MEEMIDVLDSLTGKKTGEIISKNVAHEKGIWHGAIHIWIISSDKKRILLQRRCSDKKLFPNMWDISVGGHIGSGEEAIESAFRELSEELGISKDINLEFVTKIKEEFNYKNINSKEFVFIYKTLCDIDINLIKLQKEEVSDVKWISKSEFNRLILEKQIIDHSEEYELINEILVN